MLIKNKQSPSQIPRSGLGSRFYTGPTYFINNIYFVVAVHFNEHRKYIKNIFSFSESLFDSMTTSITFYYLNQSSVLFTA
jgi:hypothetical protein